MEKQVIIYRESAIQSIISDIGTFLLFAGLFAVNHFWLVDSKWSAFVFTVLCVLWFIAKAGAKKNVFTDKEKAIEYLQALKDN